MLAVIAILVFPFLFLMGETVISIMYGMRVREGVHLEDRLLTGGLCLVGLAEGAHLGALVSGRSVCVSAKYLGILLGGAILACLVFHILFRVVFKKRSSADAESKSFSGRARNALAGYFPEDGTERILAAVILCFLVFGLVRLLVCETIYQESDITLENVITFLYTDRIYEINPLTGSPYLAGMPSRLKLLCLPTFYADLCKLWGADAKELVWHAVPCFVFLLSVTAYACLGKSLFPDSKKKRLLFLLLVLLLLYVGDYMYGMAGFGLWHAGFQGETIRGAVLLPYLFSILLRKKWRLAIPVLLAEACLVWTLYGLGMGALTVVLWIVIRRLIGGDAKLASRGKEAAG